MIMTPTMAIKMLISMEINLMIILSTTRQNYCWWKTITSTAMMKDLHRRCCWWCFPSSWGLCAWCHWYSWSSYWWRWWWWWWWWCLRGLMYNVQWWHWYFYKYQIYIKENCNDESMKMIRAPTICDSFFLWKMLWILLIMIDSNAV